MAEYLSKKKNPNTSADDLADDMTKTARKLMSQINNRGWTENLIKDTVDNPYTLN